MPCRSGSVLSRPFRRSALSAVEPVVGGVVGPVSPAGATMLGRWEWRGWWGRFAMVIGMPDTYQDPSGNTEAFRAFAHPAAEPPAPPAKSSNLPLIVGVAAVVVIALIAWLTLS